MPHMHDESACLPGTVPMAAHPGTHDWARSQADPLAIHLSRGTFLIIGLSDHVPARWHQCTKLQDTRGAHPTRRIPF